MALCIPQMSVDPPLFLSCSASNPQSQLDKLVSVSRALLGLAQKETISDMVQTGMSGSIVVGLAEKAKDFMH